MCEAAMCAFRKWRYSDRLVLQKDCQTKIYIVSCLFFNPFLMVFNISLRVNNFFPFILPYLRFFQVFLRIRTRKMCRNFIEECYVSISWNRNRRTANCVGRSVSRGFHTYFACCSTWDLYSVLWELIEPESLTYFIKVLSSKRKKNLWSLTGFCKIPERNVPIFFPKS